MTHHTDHTDHTDHLRFASCECEPKVLKKIIYMYK